MKKNIPKVYSDSTVPVTHIPKNAFSLFDRFLAQRKSFEFYQYTQVHRYFIVHRFMNGSIIPNEVPVIGRKYGLGFIYLRY